MLVGSLSMAMAHTSNHRHWRLAPCRKGGRAMGVAITLQQYLGQQNSQFDLVPHPRAVTALRTASACHVPGDRLAKGVVLADDMGFILAVLPASRRIRLDRKSVV